ncbi:MAG: ABC transporter ATP-binding protein [Planctomycetia bacterium]|jgi:lipoprotein-releasing system ATP-binding protein|nr:ABC transporter ATP-binding protein [Planctomycetia bacterium]
MLEVDRISKSFATPSGPLSVLDDVSFVLAAGGRLAIMGPSGSGKSTLLSILGTLEEPTSGTVRLGGLDPFAALPAGRAAFRNRQIGFVFQEHQLLGSLTALDNVVVPAIASGRVTPGIETRARELLDRVGLGSRLGHLPAELSGGERQRVAVARALLLEPRLVLADEPTGQLDARTAATVTDLLVELASESGRMLVVVTHADAVARRIGAVRHLSDGRLLP